MYAQATEPVAYPRKIDLSFPSGIFMLIGFTTWEILTRMTDDLMWLLTRLCFYVGVIYFTISRLRKVSSILFFGYMLGMISFPTLLYRRSQSTRYTSFDP